MSMPNVPNITPNIDIEIEEVVNLLLVSIALEELGISHIINAEGEKIQEVIAKHGCIEDLLKIDKSVQTTLRDLIKKEMLLEFKFENILELIDKTKH
jgi:ethanolamine ammonia-lyase small subunit